LHFGAFPLFKMSDSTGVALAYGAIHFRADAGESCFFQYLSDRISHFAHDNRRAADLDIDALVTWTKSCFTGTRQRRQRTFNQSDDVGQSDTIRRLRQIIASTFTFLAKHEAASFEG